MKKIISISLATLLLFCLYSLSIGRIKIQANPPSSVSDTLSSSQLSYFAVLQSGITAGNTYINILTNGNAPSRTTNNLFVGDTVAIGIGSSMRTFTVNGVGATNTFSIGATTITQDLVANSVAIATRSATHVVSFTPQTFSAGGKWQILIKTTSTAGETYNDGIPDQNGFDLGIGFTSTDVNCSALGAGSTPVAATIGTTAVVTTGYPATTNSYLVFECTTPTGTAPINVGTSISIGATHQLINPSAATGHTEGTGDLSNFLIRHFDSGANLLSADTYAGRIVTIEAVRVTATIDPTISFSIAGLGAGNRCGVPVNTTQQAAVSATQVPFGSLAIGSTINTLAQQLTVITNGIGYVVTAYSPRVMTNIDGTGTTIPATICDSGPCTATLATGWTAPNPNQSGFGYSLESFSGSPTMAFTAGANFTAKPFTTVPTTIFSYNSTPTTNHVANVCYRATATSFQKTGNYEAQVVYTATATF